MTNQITINELTDSQSDYAAELEADIHASKRQIKLLESRVAGFKVQTKGKAMALKADIQAFHDRIKRNRNELANLLFCPCCRRRDMGTATIEV